MTTLNRSQTATALQALGWRTNTPARFDRAVRDFQAAWNLGPALKVDGRVGPATSQALRVSLSRHAARRPDASEHFAFAELACRCGGKHADCRRIVYTRRQLAALERLRAAAGGRPLDVISAYRCPSHNAAVGGARLSQHKNGRAADVPGRLTVAQVRALGVFTGIGWKRSTGRVVHVDTRPLRPTRHPAVWEYA